MNHRMLLPRPLAAASLLLLGMTPALAGVFSVTPVRIFMKPRDRAVAVTLVNEGDAEVALQADINAWTQKPDGTDELVLTEDMILSPPIIKLAPHARQVVRLALLKPADASRQLTYRMVVREIPEAVAPRGNTMEVPIALALSLPVFITPPSARRDLSCEAARPDPQTVQAVCSNSGTAYAQIREIQLRRNGQVLARFEGGNYLLPGVRKAIALKAGEPVAAGTAELGVVFDDFKTQAFTVTLP
ncbi:MAG: molecular chaperone [Ramlibacter sp.]|nr:molecular chaperone [Ramlibacter sp.]